MVLPEQQARASARMPTAAGLPDTGWSCTALERAFDSMGCDVKMPNAQRYRPYYQRALDLDARLRLVASARWLAAQAGDADLARRFAERPAELASVSAQPASFDPATRRLSVPTPGRKAEDVFTIALPGSRVAADAAASRKAKPAKR